MIQVISNADQVVQYSGTLEHFLEDFSGGLDEYCREHYYIQIDRTRIDNIVVDGFDYRNYPDFCDAFIVSADVDGRPATEAEINFMNTDMNFVYDQVEKEIY